MNRKQKITLIIFLVIIICLIMIIRKSNIFVDLYDDILILKNISNVQKQGDKQNKDDIVKYTFDIKCKNIDFKSVNLNETIKRETLINNKIAPGLEGQFDIVIKANQDTKYSIKFQIFCDRCCKIILIFPIYSPIAEFFSFHGRICG